MISHAKRNDHRLPILTFLAAGDPQTIVRGAFRSPGTGHRPSLGGRDPVSGRLSLAVRDHALIEHIGDIGF
jgi:hypothetical protein